MRVPLTVADSIERAELVYPDRVGVVDEPDPPGGGLGTLTYGRMAELARAQAGYQKALEADDNPHSWFNLGATWALAENRERALDGLKKALAGDPDLVHDLQGDLDYAAYKADSDFFPHV